jgi:hypothetical protein
VFNREVPPGRRHWGRVRAAQLRELGPAMRLAAWGQTFNAIFLSFFLADQVPPLALALWLLALALASLFATRQQRLLRGRVLTSVGRRTLDRVAYQGVMFGIIWLLPARYFFGFATQAQQLALCILSAIMMAGAAFVLAPIPGAAAGFAFMAAIAISHMLAETGNYAIALLGPVYMMAMFGFIYINGRSFMQKTGSGSSWRKEAAPSASCCANMKAATPTGCGKQTAISSWRMCRPASPARSAAAGRRCRSCRSRNCLPRRRVPIRPRAAPSPMPRR